MGVNASAASENDFDPVPDFEPVGSKSTTVTFKAENDDGDPINARIYVGHYEARASPIADTNPTTTGPINLDDTAKFAPAKYEFVAHAPGYGHVRFDLDLRSSHKHKKKARTVEIEFPTNWASATSGATVTTPNVGATVGGSSTTPRAHSGPRTRTTSLARRRRDHRAALSRWTASRRRSTSQGARRFASAMCRSAPTSGRTAAGSRRCGSSSSGRATATHPTARPTQGSARCTRARSTRSPAIRRGPWLRT